LPACLPAGQQYALLISSITVTNMPSGETATFHCSEWLRSADPYDLELDAAPAEDGLEVWGRRGVGLCGCMEGVV